MSSIYTDLIFLRTPALINNLSFDVSGHIKKLTRHVLAEGSRALGHWRQTCGSFKSELVWLQSECVSVCGPALEASRFASSKSKRAVVTSPVQVAFMFWFLSRIFWTRLGMTYSLFIDLSCGFSVRNFIVYLNNAYSVRNYRSY